MLLASASAVLAAQGQVDPVRLDDFAVKGSPDNSLEVEQLSTHEDNAGSAPQSHERTVVTESPLGPPNADVPQLSRSGETPDQAQLSEGGSTPDESSAAVSSPAQSRPDGVQRLAGSDRCDPQLGGSALARCRHILELRAQEFHAPTAPQLSPEQKLLSEQLANEHGADRSAETRVRLASRDDPDAELPTNQELASLYLDRPASSPDQAPDQAAPVPDASLAQVLEALQEGGAAPQGGS